MASYIPGVTDFIPDIQPFQPDWSTIDRTMRTKQGRYDQNYSALQGTYSGLLNMPQLKQSQINKRDQFLKQAFKNIGDLSSVDLSLPENASSAQQVFAPLYTDQEFLGNAAVSKHYNTQEEYADSLRQKDGGKEFSMDNLNYVRMQRQEYIQDEAPDAWKKYHSNKKYYEPYYDYSKEYRDAMAQFKPSASSITRMNGMYFVTTDDKSWKEQEIKDYLNATLSEKAKRQMQIEGSVRLGASPEAIVSEYKAVGVKQLNSYAEKLQEVDAAILETKDPKQKQQLYDLKSKLSDQLQETQTHLQKASENDYEYVKNNREALAYQIYYDKLINKVADGFAHTDIKEEITENNVALGMWKDSQEWGRMNARFKHEYNMKLLDGQLDAQKASREAATKKREEDALEQGVAFALPSTEGDVKLSSLATVHKEIEGVKSQKFALTEELRTHIAEVKGIPANKASLISWKMVKEYMNSPRGKKDTFLNGTYKPGMSRLSLMEEAQVGQIRAAEKSALDNLSPQQLAVINQVKNTMSKVPTVTVNQAGQVLHFDPNEVFRGLSTGEMKIKTFGTRTGAEQYLVYKDKTGVERTVPIGGASVPEYGQKVGAMVRQVQMAMGKNAQIHDIYNQYQENINEYFGEKKTAIRNGLIYADNSKIVNRTKEYLSTALGTISAEKLGGLVYDFADDRVYFNIKATENDAIDPEAIVNRLKAGKMKAAYDSTTQKFYVESSKIPGTSAYTNLSPNEQALLKIGHEAEDQYESPFFQSVDPEQNPTLKVPSFRFKKVMSPSGDGNYYLYMDGETKPLRRGKRYEDLSTLLSDTRMMTLNPRYLEGILQE